MNDVSVSHLPQPPAAPIPLTALPWKQGPAWAFTGLSILSILVCGGFAGAIRMADEPEWVIATKMGLLLCLAYLIPLAAVWFYARRKGFGLRGAVGLRPMELVPGLALAFALALLGRVIAGVWGLAIVALELDIPGMDIDPTQMLPPGPVGVVFTILSTVILAPFVEEIVFRGVLLPALHDRRGKAAAIAVSSAAFAIMHLAPASIPPIALLAVILGMSFVRSRTLWMPIAVHGFFNGMGVFLLYAFQLAGLQ